MRAQKIFREVKILSMVLLKVIIHLSKPTEYIPKEKPKLWTLGDYEHQCRLANYNKCTTLVGGVDNRESYECRGVWEISALSILL